MDISPIIISMKTATIAILFTFILGLLAARWILYRKSEAAKIFWDGIFTMPLVLPPTVAGFFLLVFFGSYGPVGKLFEDYLGIRIAFSWGATILAAVVMSFPLMYRSARGALEQIDDDLIRCTFEEPQRAMTPGQALVFYDGEYVAGGGTIIKR